MLKFTLNILHKKNHLADKKAIKSKDKGIKTLHEWTKNQCPSMMINGKLAVIKLNWYSYKNT